MIKKDYIKIYCKLRVRIKDGAVMPVFFRVFQRMEFKSRAKNGLKTGVSL